MRVIITAKGLYFFGKAKDFRPWLRRLAAGQTALAEHLRLRLH